MACIEGAAAGELKVGFCLGGNLYGSNPDATFAAEALGKLDQIVYLSTTLNTGHAHGLARETIILPVLARDEEPQPTTQESMFNYVRLSDGGPRRHEGPRSEVEVIAAIAERVFRSRMASRRLSTTAMLATALLAHSTGPPCARQPKSASRSPASCPASNKLAEIDRTKQEFQIGGRTFHEPQFATPDGRARLHTHELPELHGHRRRRDAADDDPQRRPVQHGRLRGRGHLPRHRPPRRDPAAPRRPRRFGVKDGDRVTVHGPAGSMHGIRATVFATIKPGNAAMYYPEANVLIGRTIDPLSRTPAFKCVVVRLESSKRSTAQDSKTPASLAPW